MSKKQTVKFWKYSGIFLIATGILHSVVGIAMGKEYLLGIIKDGFFNTTQNDFPRGLAFWFLLCGIFFIILGQVLHYYIKKERQPAPNILGYWLLGVGAVGCIIIPVSGFWLFIPQALIIIIANNKGKKAD